MAIFKIRRCGSKELSIYHQDDARPRKEAMLPMSDVLIISIIVSLLVFLMFWNNYNQR